MAEKETKTKWNTFSHIYVQFNFPFCGPAAHNDFKLRTENC